MTSRLEELALRRQALQLSSERLRQQIAADGGAIEASVERALATARSLSSPLLWIAGGTLAVLVLRSPRPLAVLTRGLVALSMLRRISALLGRGAARAERQR